MLFQERMAVFSVVWLILSSTLRQEVIKGKKKEKMERGKEEEERKKRKEKREK